MTRTLRTLLTGLVDYAGLFPPARLGMQEAVETYNRCLIGPHEWMLGRFICPVSRLGEFSAAAAPFMPGTFATSGYAPKGDSRQPWRVSVLIDGPLESSIAAIDEFNAKHSEADAGEARIETIEMRASEVSLIDQALDVLPEDMLTFFEFPVSCAAGDADCRGFVAALAGTGAAAKIRTGGIVGDAFPTGEEVVSFLYACAAAGVPFKATAGLHHPIRGSHRLTYEKDSPSHPMHGFLNVFVAAALVSMGRLDRSKALDLLGDEEPANFKFGEDALTWHGWGLDAAQVARARESFALSFGSCSFDEPVEDLGKLGLM